MPAAARSRQARRSVVQRRDPERVPRLPDRDKRRALRSPGAGDSGVVFRQQRHPQHADRFGKIAGGAGAAFPGDLPEAALVLHGADQGAGQREIPLALPRLRAGKRRHDHRRCHGESRRAGDLLHGGNPRQHGAARRRTRAGGRRDHGRVPLLLGRGARLRLAGAAAHPAAGALSADVRHAGRNRVFRGNADRL